MPQDNIIPENYDVSQADTRIIAGDQGSGKSLTSTMIVVEECYANITGLITPQGEHFKAKPLNASEQKSLEARGIAYNPLKHIRVFSNTDNSSKIIVKKDGGAIESPIRVFSNYKFYGIRYRYLDVQTIIETINDDTLTNAFLVVDENTATDKQDSMTAIGKMVSKFGAQGRRRKLHTIIIAQYLDMVNSRFIRFATTRVTCSYDKYTHMVDLDVNQNSDFMQPCSYYAPDYWKFYKHDEIVKQPQAKVDKLLADMNNSLRG